ncbi:hypothetical protein RSSM_02686, partial [Rhodopirellula sallentina SM41]
MVCVFLPSTQPLQVQPLHSHFSPVQQPQPLSQEPQPQLTDATAWAPTLGSLHFAQEHVLHSHFSSLQHLQSDLHWSQPHLVPTNAHFPDWQHAAFVNAVTSTNAACRSESLSFDTQPWQVQPSHLQVSVS